MPDLSSLQQQIDADPALQAAVKGISGAYTDMVKWQQSDPVHNRTSGPGAANAYYKTLPKEKQDQLAQWQQTLANSPIEKQLLAQEYRINPMTGQIESVHANDWDWGKALLALSPVFAGLGAAALGLGGGFTGAAGATTDAAGSTTTLGSLLEDPSAVTSLVGPAADEAGEGGLGLASAAGADAAPAAAAAPAGIGGPGFVYGGEGTWDAAGNFVPAAAAGGGGTAATLGGIVSNVLGGGGGKGISGIVSNLVGDALQIWGASRAAGAATDAASIQADAAKYAAQLQAQAAQNSLGFQQQVWNQTQKNMAPFIATGQGAARSLGALMGFAPDAQGNMNPVPASTWASVYPGVAPKGPAPAATQPVGTVNGKPTPLSSLYPSTAPAGAAPGNSTGASYSRITWPDGSTDTVPASTVGQYQLMGAKVG